MASQKDTSTKSKANKSIVTKIINGIIFLFMTPFYPIKKMLDYRDDEVWEEE